MPQMVTLSTMAGLAVVGAIAGVQLGRGAVSEINPAYFSSEQSSRFFGDLAPGGYQPASLAWSSPEDAHALVNNVNLSGRPECFGCSNFVESEEITSENETGMTDQVLEPMAPAPAGPVDRYVDFAVTEDQAQRPTAGMDQVGQTAEEVSDSGEVAAIGM